MKLFSYGIVLGLVVVATVGAQAQEPCRSVDARELRDLLTEKSQIQEIVFFASWCSACQDHLAVAAKNGRSIAVGVFDDKDRYNRVMDHFPGVACYYDRDGSVVDQYNVSHLPFRWDRSCENIGGAWCRWDSLR